MRAPVEQMEAQVALTHDASRVHAGKIVYRYRLTTLCVPAKHVGERSIVFEQLEATHRCGEIELAYPHAIGARQQIGTHHAMLAAAKLLPVHQGCPCRVDPH